MMCDWITNLFCSPRVTVRFSCILGGKTLNSHQHFIDRLREGLPILEETSDKDSDVILIFCPVVSRAGTDIEAALQKVEASSDSKPAVLVVLYHKFDKDFPLPDSSRAVKRENVLTVDCLFSEDRGLLPCHKNQEALDKATEWIKSLVKTQDRSDQVKRPPLTQDKKRIQELEEEVEKMKQEIKEKNKDLEQLKQEIKEKNKDLEQLKQEIEEKNKDLEQLKQETEEKNKELEQLKEEAEERKNDLKGLEQMKKGLPEQKFESNPAHFTEIQEKNKDLRSQEHMGQETEEKSKEEPEEVKEETEEKSKDLKDLEQMEQENVETKKEAEQMEQEIKNNKNPEEPEQLKEETEETKKEPEQMEQETEKNQNLEEPEQMEQANAS